MNLLEITFGQILEAVYFSLFLILAKKIKNKRLLFIFIMVFDYIALKHFIKFNVIFQLIYTFMTYLTLKFLYKEKAIITDIFVFMIASLSVIITSILSYVLVYFTLNNFYIALVINRLMLCAILFLFRNKLPDLYKNYRFLWNRHRDMSVKIRSLTLRNISIILFNLMFCVINIGMFIVMIYGK